MPNEPAYLDVDQQQWPFVQRFLNGIFIDSTNPPVTNVPTVDRANGWSDTQNISAPGSSAALILQAIPSSGGYWFLLQDADSGQVISTPALSLPSQDRVQSYMDGSGARVLVGNTDVASITNSLNLGKVDLQAQTANITTTNLTQGPTVGNYIVEVYLECTTLGVGAGTLAVTIGWTDDVGATTSPVITGFPLTTTGRTPGRQHLRLASGEITYAVTVTGIYSTAAYAVYVRVIYLG